MKKGSYGSSVNWECVLQRKESIHSIVQGPGETSSMLAVRVYGQLFLFLQVFEYKGY